MCVRITEKQKSERKHQFTQPPYSTRYCVKMRISESLGNLLFSYSPGPFSREKSTLFGFMRSMQIFQN